MGGEALISTSRVHGGTPRRSVTVSEGPLRRASVASAVGAAATRAVVSSILLIVIATAILTVIFNVLGI